MLFSFLLNLGYTSSREENPWLEGSFHSESHVSQISWNELCQISQNLMLARRWRLREGTSSALMKPTQAKSWKIKERGCWKGQLEGSVAFQFKSRSRKKKLSRKMVIGRVREGIFIFLTSQTTYSVSLCLLTPSINTALMRANLNLNNMESRTVNTITCFLCCICDDCIDFMLVFPYLQTRYSQIFTNYYLK